MLQGIPRVSSTNTSGIRPGNGKSVHTYTVSVVWWYLAIPGRVAFSEDGFCTAFLPVNLTAEMEGGKGSSRATFAVEEGISKWYRDPAYTSEAQQYQGRSSNSF